MLNEKIELNRLGVWQKYFIKPYDQESYGILRAGARLRSDNFLKDVRDKAINVDDGFDSASHCPELDKWVESETGQTTLASLLEELQDLVKSSFELLEDRQTRTRQQLLPIGHDKWQMAKDAAEALRYLEMERPQGYKAAFVIPTAFHDLGRILEGWMMDDKNPHTNWVPHAQLSFLMLDDVLSQQKYQAIPKELKNHFLYAVLAHSYSENGQSYMSRAVQACDRMQLIGPEGVFRAWTFIPAYKLDGAVGYPKNGLYNQELPQMYQLNESMPVIEYFARCMPRNQGDSHGQWRNRIELENLALLLTYQTAVPTILDPKKVTSARGNHKIHSFDQDKIERARAYLQLVKTQNHHQISPKDMMDMIVAEVQRPAGAAAITDQIKARLLSAVMDMDSKERMALLSVFHIAKDLRLAQERDDFDVVQRAAAADSIIARTATTSALELFSKTCPDQAPAKGYAPEKDHPEPATLHL
ncbi:MAG: hypothetical protein AUJ12_09295 [Alphaproteobacteria bacterium CG1_02_46_17]|nr:MAG: hypothetical protein AUJ12_09295 [Alphaproteobacteria bacterium CG1_02_46_17]